MAQNHIGEKATVCGNVASSYYASSRKGKPTFLNLGEAYPNNVFTVIIWGEHRRKFNKPEVLYKGQTMCVSGKIKYHRKGAMITLYSEKQLNITPAHRINITDNFILSTNSKIFKKYNLLISIILILLVLSIIYKIYKWNYSHKHEEKISLTRDIIKNNDNFDLKSTIIDIPNYDSLKKLSYKEIPITDGQKYTGTILKINDYNETIILDIENIGIYKIKLPQRKPWCTLKENSPFTFFREKYNGNGNNSHVTYSKLEIIKKEFFVKNKEKCKNNKSYYGIYYPWHNGNNPSFNDFSSKILDFKNNKPNIINYFFDLLKNVNFDCADVIVIVPSHDPKKTTSAIKSLAQKIAYHKNLIDGTSVIKRNKKISKLAQGGKRDIDVHLNSLTINEFSLIKGKNVLIFDDVSTTGNSLKATMQLLKRFGAHSVCAYTIAKTSVEV